MFCFEIWRVIINNIPDVETFIYPKFLLQWSQREFWRHKGPLSFFNFLLKNTDLHCPFLKIYCSSSYLYYSGKFSLAPCPAPLLLFFSSWSLDNVKNLCVLSPVEPCSSSKGLGKSLDFVAYQDFVSLFGWEWHTLQVPTSYTIGNITTLKSTKGIYNKIDS